MLPWQAIPNDLLPLQCSGCTQMLPLLLLRAHEREGHVMRGLHRTPKAKIDSGGPDYATWSRRCGHQLAEGSNPIFPDRRSGESAAPLMLARLAKYFHRARAT